MPKFAHSFWIKQRFYPAFKENGSRSSPAAVPCIFGDKRPESFMCLFCCFDADGAALCGICIGV